MDYQQLAERLFPQIQLTPDDIEARYPARQLPEGAKVTRIAPSPTGFMHMGNLYGAIVDERLAHQSGGFIEDFGVHLGTVTHLHHRNAGSAV